MKTIFIMLITFACFIIYILFVRALCYILAMNDMYSNTDEYDKLRNRLDYELNKLKSLNQRFDNGEDVTNDIVITEYHIRNIKFNIKKIFKQI